MKRSQLKADPARTRAFVERGRRSLTKPTRKPVAIQPGRAEWKEPHGGFCECGCDPPVFSLHLERHHVVELQTVKREGGAHFDLRNSMLLHPRHHSWHTSALHRISRARVPAPAVEFAVELLGVERAEDYLNRMYAR